MYRVPVVCALLCAACVGQPDAEHPSDPASRADLTEDNFDASPPPEPGGEADWILAPEEETEARIDQEPLHPGTDPDALDQWAEHDSEGTTDSHTPDSQTEDFDVLAEPEADAQEEDAPDAEADLEPEPTCTLPCPGCSDCTWYYVDNDGDGHGDSFQPPQCLCNADGPWSAASGKDCDDYNSDVHPGALAISGADADCDGALIDAGEECDDGNDQPWDGCNEGALVEFQVNEVGAGPQRVTGIAALESGLFGVVWTTTSFEGAGDDVYLRWFDTAGNALKSEQRVHEETAGDQSGATLCGWANDRAVIVWTAPESGVGTKRLWARLVDAHDEQWSPAFFVDISQGKMQERPAVVCHPDGRFTVLWNQQNSGETGLDILARTFLPDGIHEGSTTTINSTVEDSQFEPSAARFSEGSLAAVWTSFGQDGDLEGVYGRLLDSNLQAETDEFQVNQVWQNFQVDQRIAVLSDDRFVTVWQSETLDETMGDLFGRFYLPDGTPSTDEFPINMFDLHCQDHPQIAALPDGGFAVTWRSYGQDGNGWGVFGQYFSAEGKRLDEEFQVNDFETGNQWHPRLGAFPDGTLAIAWTSFGQDEEMFGVFARRYNPDRTKRYR